MRKNKPTVVLCFGICLVLLTACGGGGKYGEISKALGQTSDFMEAFIESMDNAEDGKAVATAMNAFADGMSALRPKLKELEKKYPEMADESNVPEELKSLMEKMTAMGPRMMNAMMKAHKFKDDPEVMKAQERLNELMQ